MDLYHHHHQHHHHHHQSFHEPSSRNAFEITSSPTPRHPQQWSRNGAAQVSDQHSNGRDSGNFHPTRYPLQTGLGSPYDSEPASPTDGTPPTSDLFRRATTAAMVSFGASAEASNPKRAYRQRRKDPSCDACRERKVKCDATETASCSECASRNVWCQFTKETNRRMSSIKQFQDLERQLQQAHQQLAHFKSIASRTDITTDPKSKLYAEVDLLPAGSPPAKREKLVVAGDLSQVRWNLKDNGRGLLQIPSLYRGTSRQTHKPLEIPDLPPRHRTERLLVAYHDNFHVQFPVLHWPTFQDQCEQLYQTGSVAALGAAWVAVFLCVLACATLHDPDADASKEGKTFLAMAIATTDVWKNDFSIQEAQMSFLTTVFLVELNLKAAGWIWLGSAARIAQEIGLHIESGSWPPIEGELRRRLWYSIYSWDRLLALELGKPLLINDCDCDTAYPEAAEDDQITDKGIHQRTSSTPLLATIHIVRSFQSLTNLLKSRSLSQDALEARERYFHGCLSMLPETFQPSARVPLDPRTIAPLIYLQNARLILQRHNLSPASSPACRLEAMEQCVGIARDTARVMSRCLESSPTAKHVSDTRSSPLAVSASTLLCMHIWRCLLLLLFRGEYAPALALVQAASSIGPARRVNGFCGRYAEFFLRTIYSRIQMGHLGNFDNDEELIAYASGDLQNSPDSSWIWEESDGNSDSNYVDSAATAANTSDPSGSTSSDGGLNPDEIDAEVGEWRGWDFIADKVQSLLDLSHHQRQAAADSSDAQAAFNLSSDASRMTIASII